MIMLPGSPGNARDWARAAGVLGTANAWARAHRGNAPVMVFIDENGARNHDTECLDSAEGDAESYLTYSVPTFIERVLGIVPNPDRWAIVGFSEGGTCALTLALTHPGLYGRFVDIAGDPAANYWGGPVMTLRVLYRGSVTREEHHTPSWLLEHNRYPSVAAWFATARSDPLHPETAHLVSQAEASGMAVNSISSPGAHTWAYASKTFDRIYPALVPTISAATPTGP
jgi:S-formylglutathione hydrolase FrmB